MTKPKRGNCGTCHWFELNPQPIDINASSGPRSGFCFVSPPVPIIMQTQRAIGVHGPTVESGLSGMVPPTNENRRCEKWRPAGMLPTAALPGGVAEIYPLPIDGTQKDGTEQ